MKFKHAARVFFATISLAAPALAQQGVGDFRTSIEKWVETRQILSQERSEWEVEREDLRATRELLLQEKKMLEAEIADLEASTTAADDERRQLLLDRGEHQRANQALEVRIRGLEEELLALSPRLPAPLQKRLEPLLVQIPREPEFAKLQLGQRLMNVLGIVAQAEKFNGTATFVGETRAVADGRKLRVRTLYWGLGQAIYVDANGETAGIGRPGRDGWSFSNDPGLADAAKRLLDIYEGKVDTIEFVLLPVDLERTMDLADGPGPVDVAVDFEGPVAQLPN